MKRTWEERATAFQMLSLGLTCPTQEITQAVADGSFSAEADEIVRSFPVSAALSQRYRAIAAELEATLASPTLLDDLRIEYTRLFTAPGSAAISLWETLLCCRSDQKDDFGTLLFRSPQAFDARKRYEAAQVHLTGNESPDHLRIECEFAGYLCHRRALSETGEEEAVWASHLEGFTLAHLDQWFDSFFDKLSGEARHPYFKMVSLLGSLLDLRELAST